MNPDGKDVMEMKTVYVMGWLTGCLTRCGLNGVEPFLSLGLVVCDSHWAAGW